MWKSTFVDACIATINDKSKSVCVFFLIWIILFLLLEQYLDIELAAYIFFQNVLIIMHIYGIIRFGLGKMRWASVLTDKELKTKGKEGQILGSILSEQELGHSNDSSLLKGTKVETGLIFCHFKCSLWTINLKSRPSDYLSVMRVFHILNYVYKLASNLNVAVVQYLVYMLNADMFQLQSKSPQGIFER